MKKLFILITILVASIYSRAQTTNQLPTINITDSNSDSAYIEIFMTDRTGLMFRHKFKVRSDSFKLFCGGSDTTVFHSYDFYKGIFYKIPTGTTSQYVRGDGTLTNFPTIPAATLTFGNFLTGTSFNIFTDGNIGIDTSRVHSFKYLQGQFYPAGNPSGFKTTFGTLASSDFSNQGTTHTLLHGNASGNPAWSAVNLTTDVTATLPITSGGTGQTTALGAIDALLPSQTSQSGKVLSTNGTNPSWITAATGADTINTPVIKTTKIVLNPTQLATLFTSPVAITAFAAPGAGYMWQVINTSIKYTFNSVDPSFATIEILPETGTFSSSQQAGFSVSPDASDYIITGYLFQSATTSLPNIMDNKGLVIQSESDDTNSTDGSFTVYVTAQLIKE